MSPTDDAVKVASKIDLPVLEGLRLALGSLKDPERPWNFSDWTQCTCGHIYAGAHGGKIASHLRPVVDSATPRSRYGRMLKAIIRANDLDELTGREGSKALAFIVSDGTDELAARRARDPYRAPKSRALKNAAITLVEKAIKHVEAEQRDAMQKAAAA